MSYYRGDYYRGDPFLGGLRRGLKRLGRATGLNKAFRVASGLTGAAAGIVGGPALRVGLGFLGGGTQAQPSALPFMATQPQSPVLMQAGRIPDSPVRRGAARRKRRRTTRRLPPGTTRTASGRYRSAFLGRRRASR